MLVGLLGRVPGLGALVVADNAADTATAAIVAAVPFEARYLAVAGNPGVGVALNRAIHHAERCWGDRITHFWILDDDVSFEPEVLEQMLAALRENEAAAAAPTVCTRDGQVFDWPKLSSRRIDRHFRALKAGDPAAFAKSWRGRPLPTFRSCVGVFWLFESRCRRAVGEFREDFFLYAEDSEYSARLAQRFRAVFCPHIKVIHYFGASPDSHAGRGYYLKSCTIVQNNLYMALHLSHTRHFVFPLLGSLRRFLVHLKSAEAAFDLLWMVWYGGVLGQPAGTESGQRLRERRQNYRVE